MDTSPTLSFRSEEEMKEYINIAVQKALAAYPVPFPQTAETSQINTAKLQNYNVPTYSLNDQVKIKLFNNIEFQSNSDTFLKSLAIVGALGLTAAILLKK